MPRDLQKGKIKEAIKFLNEEQHFEPMDNATFAEFSAELRKAANEGNPYTHIHILAHGSLIFDHKKPSNFEYGIAFKSDTPLEEPYKATSAEEIKSLFESLDNDHLPYMVNYMVCDGANFTNGVKPNKNPIQATFDAGVPMVLGSQFPLSMPGADYFTKRFYKALFRGVDVRKILGDVRTGLYKKSDDFGFDWVSLVAYLDLPKNYEFELLKNKTNIQLNVLNHYRDKGLNDSESKDDFIALKANVSRTLDTLNEEVIALQGDSRNEELFLEYCGLLASGYKRLAYIEHVESGALNSDTTDEQIKFLKKARTQYQMASNQNLSHHWSSVQYLSLQMVLTGKFTDEDLDLWHATRLAAETAVNNNSEEYWAFGTLMELLLLNPHPATNDAERLIAYANALVNTAGNVEIKGTDPLQSTYEQLKKYREWWNAPAFKIPQKLLAKNMDLLQKAIAIVWTE
ncbi:MAG: CHAT domain-containing protein [Bacteroidota bacterium]